MKIATAKAASFMKRSFCKRAGFGGRAAKQGQTYRYMGMGSQIAARRAKSQAGISLQRKMSCLLEDCLRELEHFHASGGPP